MPTIHPTAVVDGRAELADDVIVGAYTIIKGHVTLGPGCVVQEHCHLHGRTVVGPGCQIGPAAYVGLPPQHLRFSGEPTDLHIGAGTIIRETATVHRATKPGPENATRVGERCFLMGGAHVGHDCQVGDDVTMANGVMLGGHVTVGSRAFLGGGAAIHQFVRVGRLSIIAGNQAASMDVPPFGAMHIYGLKGYNAVGCRRAGLSRESVQALRAAYRCLHTIRLLRNVIKAIRDKVPMVPEVQELVAFFETTKRGIEPSVRYARFLGSATENIE